MSENGKGTKDVPGKGDYEMSDKDYRRKVYNEVDTAKFSWFHVKAILISGVGFFTDAYDLFVIGIVKPMIAIVYYPQFNGKLRLSDDLWVTGIALTGTLLGQVIFGMCGDYLGRKKVYLLTLLLIIAATIGQCLAASTAFGIGIIPILLFWRFVLGFGIGGDYPLSATIVAEYASSSWRGAFLAAVFSAQGFGILTGSLMGVIWVAIFKDKIENTDILYLDIVWRIIIGMGAIPAVATIYMRSKLPETPRYTTDVIQDVEKAAANLEAVKRNDGKSWDDGTKKSTKDMDRISPASLHKYLTYPTILRNRNFWVLIGTCSTWCLLDVAFYSQNLFLPNVLSYIGYSPDIALPQNTIYKAHWNATLGQYGSKGPNGTWNSNPAAYRNAIIAQAWNSSTFDKNSPGNGFSHVFLYNTPSCVGPCASQVYQKVYKTAAGNAIVALMGTVPGYFFTVAFVDKLGRVPIQFGGFAIMTALLIVLASAYNSIVGVSKWLFIVMYAGTFFFANFGPNATTFITPVELFNTKFRSTLHGISAACGKSGAIIGAFVIGRYFTLTTLPLQTALAILACTNAVGFCCTIFIPETKLMTLEDASSISESMFGKFLRRHGIVQICPEFEASQSREIGEGVGDVLHMMPPKI